MHLHILKLPSASNRRRSARRHLLDNGQRAANLRAITAARLLAGGMVPSIAAAAESCGSNKSYVWAATILLKAENPELKNSVLNGKIGILEAAAQVKRVAALVSAYRAADDSARIAFAKTCGIDPLLDMLAEAAE
jgi:hypothetical protein